jgi:type IV pilus assembly protein PilQ
LSAFSYAREDSTNIQRIREIESRLKLLAGSSIPELNAKVDFSVSEASVREFLRGLAESADLNINVNPAIEGIITNNFKKETALNVIVFLCREYDLEFEVIGTILSFSQIREEIIIPKKEYNIQYAAYNDLLSIDVRNDTLFNVLKDISQKSRKNVSAVPEIQDLLITAFIASLPFEEAIQSLAYANNLIVSNKDRQSFFLQPGGYHFANRY